MDRIKVDLLRAKYDLGAPPERGGLCSRAFSWYGGGHRYHRPGIFLGQCFQSRRSDRLSRHASLTWSARAIVCSKAKKRIASTFYFWGSAAVATTAQNWPTPSSFPAFVLPPTNWGCSPSRAICWCPFLATMAGARSTVSMLTANATKTAKGLFGFERHWRSARTRDPVLPQN